MPVAAKVTKTACPTIRVFAALRLPSLRCRSAGTLRRTIHGPSELSRRPASKPAAQPLRSASSMGRFGSHRIISCSPDAIRDSDFQAQTSPDCIRATIQSHARTNSPVRRVSGIDVEGVERHGCRESCAGPWTAHRSGPLERRWSERTRFAAKRRSGPDAGRAFSLLTFSLRVQRESEAPCKAQQEIEYLKNVAAKLPANGIKKAPDYQSSNTPTPSQTMHRGHKACDRAASYAAATCTGTLAASRSRFNLPRSRSKKAIPMPVC